MPQSSSGNSLGRLKVDTKSGSECFHSQGADLDYTLLEFWRWNVSDLVSNTTRGVLAEFIVAKALGIETTVRDEWAAHDLTTADGVKIEVKSAAYVQIWAQKRYSAIQFRTPKSRAWDPNTNVLDTESKRHADVYVFALLAHKDKSTIDPLDLSQWQFYAVPTATLDARGQGSISLSVLNSICPPVDYQDLRQLVARTGKRL